MFLYCPKCGLIFKNKTKKSCPACDGITEIVPSGYLSSNGNFFASPEIRAEFISKVVESGELFDASLARQRDFMLKEKEMSHKQDVLQRVEEYKESCPKLKCPVCGSTKLSNISTLGKVVKISALGVWGAGDLGKKRRCETCGHKF